MPNLQPSMDYITSSANPVPVLENKPLASEEKDIWGAKVEALEIVGKYSFTKI